VRAWSIRTTGISKPSRTSRSNDSTQDYEKIDGDVWLPFTWESDFRLEFAKLIKDAGHDESRCSHYRKLDAKSSIIYAP
jgi:hypothetical protein